MFSSKPTLEWVKSRKWFYQFELPDKSVTSTDIPDDILKIHDTRRKYLEDYINSHIPNASNMSALDLASHEGYFSWVLSKYFKSVTSVEQRKESIESAKKIGQFLKWEKIRHVNSKVEDLAIEDYKSDFVLMYGLLYHVENPIFILRQAAALSKRYLCIETQVLPYHISGGVEDGNYKTIRPIQCVFGVAEDYPEAREGGVTNLAMIPSTQGLVWILKQLGFSKVDVVDAKREDYEQFYRQQRIVVFAER